MSKPPKIEKPRIAVTMGDPCGVGPEIIVKAFTSIDPNEVGPALIVGDPLPLLRSIERLGADLKVRTVDDPSEADRPSDPKTLFVLQTRELREEDIRCGRPTASTCAAVVSYIETATRLAMARKIEGVCTCPINKANLHRHGFAFPGHTEFLQQLTGAESVVMMLAGPRLRVSLATIHHPIADVPGLLSREGLYTTIRITAESLRRDFDLKTARIAVAALNPHAGEEGRFGREEIDLIGPVVERFQGGPYAVTGPHPPDTLFHRAFQGEFDAVVAMYHDQGLIPIKLVHFHDAVNVSLGLPIIRTSVDHGTAYDLAGTGKAGSGSLEAAIRLAAAMALNRSRNLPTPPVDFGLH